MNSDAVRISAFTRYTALKLFSLKKSQPADTDGYCRRRKQGVVAVRTVVIIGIGTPPGFADSNYAGRSNPLIRLFFSAILFRHYDTPVNVHRWRSSRIVILIRSLRFFGGGSNPLICGFLPDILFRHYETVYRNQMSVLRS